MTRLLLWLACAAVRLWTRAYTYAMPARPRDERRAEIESDLWEWQHDPERAAGAFGAAQVFQRLLLGMPDDLVWRMAHVTNRKVAVLRTFVTVLMFAVVWAYVQWLSPSTLPQPPSPRAFVVGDRPLLPPPPPPPPPPSPLP
jgi:hypothetical protein